MKLIYTANCGVIIEGEKSTISIDALHDHEEKPFSTVPGPVIDRIMNGIRIDVMFYTHLHRDHFSRELNREYINRYHPETIMQEDELATIGLSGDKGRISINRFGLEADYKRLTHSGDRYKDVLNYGFYIVFEGVSFLTLGDGAVSAEGIDELTGGRRCDFALINFPFYTLAEGRRIIGGLINPKAAIIQHLPFEKDDRFQYRRALEKRIGYPGLPEVKAVLTEPMQTVLL